MEHKDECSCYPTIRRKFANIQQRCVHKTLRNEKEARSDPFQTVAQDAGVIIFTYLDLHELFGLRSTSKHVASLARAALSAIRVVTCDYPEKAMLRFVARNCRSLRKLLLWTAIGKAEQGIEEVLQRCKKLTTLRSVNGKVFRKIEHELPSLTTVSVFVSSVSDLSHLARTASNLRTLELNNSYSSWAEQPNAALAHLVSKLVHLRKLVLTLFEPGIGALEALTHLPELEELLFYASAMTNTGCEVLALSAPKLRRLKVSGLSVTGYGVRALLERVPTLQGINLVFTSVRSQEIKEIFEQHALPNMRQLTVPWTVKLNLQDQLKTSHPLCAVDSVSWKDD